jgi:hypothetical protein
MNDRHSREHTAFNRLATFIANSAADFGPTSALPGLGTALKGVADDMNSAASGQLGGSGADLTGSAVGTLQNDLQLIGGIARSNNAEHPGLKDKFPTVENTVLSVTSTADAYLAQLETKPGDSPALQAAKTALGQIFIDHEMPATFVADLRADRDAIPSALTAEATKSDSKIKSTAGLDVLSQQGMQIRGRIAAGLRARYSRQPDKLRAAESAIHIERAPKRPKTPAPAAPPKP